MKKSIVIAVVGLSFAGSLMAADSHTNWQGATDKFTGVIKSQEKFEDLIKYTDIGTQVKLRAAFKDGELTAEEIKASGISDHHFYTGLLASSQTQSEYDKNLKMLNGGQNMDDKFVSNRDLKAHGSMVMNQVDTKLQVAAGQQAQVDNKQDQRLDKIVAGLQDLGNHLQAQTPTLPDQGGNEQVKPETPNTGDSNVSRPNPGLAGAVANNTNNIQQNANNIQTNTNSIQQMGAAFEQRVEKVNEWMDSTDGTLRNHGNAIRDLGTAFNAQSNWNAREIARLDGRIDALEDKTDRMKAGIAGANAIGSLVQYMGVGTHHVAVAVGGYDDASALAAGYSFAVTANTVVRGTVAYDSEGDFGYGVSVGHSW